MIARVVESESVESHVFSWSRSRFFKIAGVGVGFLKLLESESVFQNCWSRNPKKYSDFTTLQKTRVFFIGKKGRVVQKTCGFFVGKKRRAVQKPTVLQAKKNGS